MPYQSAPALLVLHALRLKGIAKPDGIVEATGLDAASVDDALVGLEVDGLVVRRGGTISGWALTPPGRTEHASRLTAELDAAGCRAEVEHCYQRFLPANEEFKYVCTDWQLRTLAGQAVPNDHRDAEYDAVIVARLGDLGAAVSPLCTGLAAALARFGSYKARFDRAWLRLSEGDRQAFAHPLSGSYHDIWMELHEDLLSTLGHSRGRSDGA